MSERRLSVIFFGNTNNYPLQLAEGFAALGHDVRLIVNRKSALHRPETIHAGWTEQYPPWVTDASDVSDEDFALQTERYTDLVRELEGPHDLAVLNDLGPALARHLRCPHVAFLTGSDLSYFCDFNVLAWRSAAWGREFKYSELGREHLRHFADLVISQRQGIDTAAVVSFAHRGLVPHGDHLLDSVGVPDEKRMMLFYTDVRGNGYREPAPDGPLRIVSGCRVLFDRDRHLAMSTQDFKGTDTLLHGFRTYCDRGGSGELRLPAKGQDVDRARELVEQMGLSERVHWLPEMPLNRFQEELAAAHVVCDQFGTSFPGMVMLGAYSLGRPVVASLRNDIFALHMPEPLPGWDVWTSDEIASTLELLDGNRDLVRQVGIDCRRYAERYLSSEAAAREILRRVGLEAEE